MGRLKCDLKGMRFGKLAAVEFLGGRGRAEWRCRCDCGEETVKQGGNLRSGLTTHCGCQPRTRRDKASGYELTNQRFGKLVAVEFVGGGNGEWRCLCDCGEETVKQGGNLRSGLTTHCGCDFYSPEELRLSKVLVGIIQRCHNPADARYHNYGGRGISVCSEWRDNPRSFIAWALTNGYKPGLEIDRTNNDGNYEPGNCSFVSRTENCRNRRNSYRYECEGVSYETSTEAADALGVSNVTILNRCKSDAHPEYTREPLYPDHYTQGE